MYRLFCFIIFSTSISYGLAQELPPVLNYTPDTYNGDNQNWSISQLSDGAIIVGNTTGLLTYDGAQWSHYPSPNESIIRSVRAVGSLIYSGAYMDFGYWETNSSGILEYTSLTDLLAIEMLEDEQIWNIIEYRDKILFQSLNRIYIYNPALKEIRHESFENGIHELFKVGDGLYVQITGKGLYSLEEGGVILVSNHKALTSELIVGLIQSQSGLVAIGQEGQYTELNLNTKQIVQKRIIDSLNLNVYTAISLRNGDLALGTISNGVFVLSEQGTIKYHLNQITGLTNNTVLALFEDRDSNIWLGLDNGVDCINNTAIYRKFSDTKGTLGTTYAMLFDHNGYDYLGTNQGLFVRAVSEETFVPVIGTEGQVWKLELINGVLWCGHNKGTYLIEGTQANQIATIPGTWDFEAVPGKANLILQGNFSGLYILTFKNGQWKLRNKIEGFNNSSKHLVLADAHTILVSHEYKGVFEIEVDDLFQKATAISKSESVTKSPNSSIVTFDNKILYGAKSGIFQYEKSSNSFVKNLQLSEAFEEDYISGVLINHGNNRLWGVTKNGLFYFERDHLEDAYRLSKITLGKDLRNTLDGYVNIVPVQNGVALGTDNGYLRINQLQSPIAPFIVDIQKIAKNTRKREPEFIALNKEANLNFTENNLDFQVAIADYQKYHETIYRYQVEGLYDQWSSWTDQTTFKIENIPPGSYIFKVQGKIQGKLSANTPTFTFSVQPPWYQSTLMRIGYVVMAILFVLALNTYYKRSYKKKQLQMVEEERRLQKLKMLETEKTLANIKNEALQNDIETRNRELATSTMNILNKNKTLNEIKDSLEALSSTDNDIQKVIKLIDSKMTTSDDWDFFEEAFNHADKDFFKKVKNKHPNLTPSDLKLCVYLRLNLSSKEIASLLNISPRSVEVKRYRLRKKMNLQREDSLINYIIEM